MAATKMVTPGMQAHANALLARSTRWAQGTRLSDGLAYYVFTSSRLGKDGQPVYYRTIRDGSGCTCPGHQHRGICCHVVAARIDAERARAAVGPKRVSYDELMDRHLVDAF